MSIDEQELLIVEVVWVRAACSFNNQQSLFVNPRFNF